MSEANPTQRISYIDAMRGFTIFLVVLAHVGTFDMGLQGTDAFSYHNLFLEFRMPVFFFVSGFVFYKLGVIWSLSNAFHFLKKKISVQIISPFLFLMASAYVRNINLLDAIFDHNKSGYWFTFALFEFFIFYILLNQVLDMLKLKDSYRDLLLVFVGFTVYMLTIPVVLVKFNIPEATIGLFGIQAWYYFLFFIIGTLIRKYLYYFESLLTHSSLVLCSIIIFFGFNVYSEIVQSFSHAFFNLLTSLTGLVLVFTFFRKHADAFSNSHLVGRILQYVGRRTLDIYLIHYFFIFSRMDAILPNFGRMDSPFIEFLFSITISIFVIAASLVVSQILRLSPTLANFLFGQK
ncbi:acyltransferase family protein [Bacteroides sp.]|uniref:acyltransferase family protein n=1 Tax=Bacteroides sp. TaxID=29523 RepID=UPI00260D926A|nr:acyltransferase family protein [Bacteroides sp.]